MENFDLWVSTFDWGNVTSTDETYITGIDSLNNLYFEAINRNIDISIDPNIIYGLIKNETPSLEW